MIHTNWPDSNTWPDFFNVCIRKRNDERALILQRRYLNGTSPPANRRSGPSLRLRIAGFTLTLSFRFPDLLGIGRDDDLLLAGLGQRMGICPDHRFVVRIDQITYSFAFAGHNVYLARVRGAVPCIPPGPGIVSYRPVILVRSPFTKRGGAPQARPLSTFNSAQVLPAHGPDPVCGFLIQLTGLCVFRHI